MPTPERIVPPEVRTEVSPTPAIHEEADPVVPPNEPAATTTDTVAASPQEAALRAFLSAPAWTQRIAHVLHPERVRDAMAAHAARHGDGPVEVTAIDLLENAGATQVFIVRTPRTPEGFPVAVLTTPNGAFQVDWQSFIEFHDDAFREFADAGSPDRGTFHLLVNPAPQSTMTHGVAKYRLNPPMPGRERMAFAEEGSTVHSRLQEAFNVHHENRSQAEREILAATGLPLVVTIAKRPDAAGSSKLWIEQVIAIGWTPGSPTPTSEP
jgi:hypothetical protein